jgi:serralysin
MSGSGTADQVRTNGTPTNGDNPWIDSLVSGGAWIDTPGLPSTGGPTTISYNYVQNQYMYGNDHNIYLARQWSNNAVTAAEGALHAWEAVANIDFVQVSSYRDTDINLWVVPSAAISGGVIDFSTPWFSNVNTLSIFFNDSTYVGNQLWDWDFSGLRPGTYGYTTLVRELGRALGLASPYTGGPAPDATLFPGVTDASKRYGDYGFFQGIYTVMSPNNGWPSQFPEHYPDNLTEYMYGWTATPMAFDIAAIQIIYGANTTYRTGNDTYLLPNGGFETSWSCIWDAGGVDEISSAGRGSRCLIDLRAATLTAGEGGGGFVSYVAGVVGGFTIAYGVVIENAAGGNANDTLIGNDANNVLTGNAGADTIFGGMGADTLNGGDGADTLNGGDGVDLIVGGADGDFLVGGAGFDNFDGGAGADTISFASETVAVIARLDLGFVQIGANTAVFEALSGIEAVIGSDFNDVINGRAGVAETISAGAGDDNIYGEGIDLINGGSGHDVLWGAPGAALSINLAGTGLEVVWGGWLSDSLDGRTCTDALVLHGQGPTGDTMLGGSNNDSIYFRTGDVISGGQGIDWAYATLSTTGVTLDMVSTQFENAWGSTQADTISAAAAITSVLIVGDTGNDLITGGISGDFLYGFAGADTLIGGLGNDNLSGNEGNDVFRFNTSNFGVDQIWDFTTGSDRIDLASSGVTRFSDLTVSVLGGHCVVSSAAIGGSQIWVLNTQSLTAADFIFV